jgi:hypothetical protein
MSDLEEIMPELICQLSSSYVRLDRLIERMEFVSGQTPLSVELRRESKALQTQHTTLRNYYLTKLGEELRDSEQRSKNVVAAALAGVELAKGAGNASLT